MAEIGWEFYAIGINDVLTEIHPTTTGTLSWDATREARKTLPGMVFLPSELATYNSAADEVRVDLLVDGVREQMGILAADRSYRQKDAIAVQGVVSDLVHLDFADASIRMRQSYETPYVIARGTEPTQVITELAEAAGLDNAVMGSNSPVDADTVHAPFSAYGKIADSLSPQAGHRPWWVDRFSTLRSVATTIIEGEIITLASLQPDAGTVVIEENYLSAPNRVVVYDSTSGLVGIWDAPASAPHSAVNRGYVVTYGEEQQGLQSGQAATDAARTIGEQFTARRLSASIVPTHLLDGPVILDYDDALWVLRSWTVSTAGTSMDLSAEELNSSE